MFILIYSNT